MATNKNINNPWFRNRCEAQFNNVSYIQIFENFTFVEKIPFFDKKSDFVKKYSILRQKSVDDTGF